MTLGDLGKTSVFEFFSSDVKAEVSILEEGIVKLKRDPEKIELLENMNFAVSAISGAAGSVGLMVISDLAKAVSDYFKEAMEEKKIIPPAELALLTECAEVFWNVSTLGEAEMIEWLVENKGDFDRLRNFLEGVYSLDEEEFEESSDAYMWQLYCQEVSAQAEALETALLLLENAPEAKENLDHCMRAAHSIKGAARIVNLEEVVSLAHATEECFVAAQKQGKSPLPYHIDLLLQCADFFARSALLSNDGKEKWLRDGKGKMQKLEAQVLDLPKQGFISKDSVTTDSAEVYAGEEASEESAEEELFYRVSTRNINDIIALSGESFVATHWLHSFGSGLQRLKSLQMQVSELFQNVYDAVSKMNGNEAVLKMMKQAQNTNSDSQQSFSASLLELDSFINRVGSIGDRLYHTSLSCRMRPFSDVVGDFPRMVRDLSRKLNKKIEFRIVGETTQVDRNILEKLKAPIGHILRNAIDHGVEGTEERLEKGKSEKGEVILEARHKGGDLVIEISDDGRGVDFEKLRHEVSERRLASPEALAQFSDDDLIDFLFHPGFSTGARVSEVSGRGVGLDVVRTMIKEANGTVSVISRPEGGTICRLQMPLALTVQQGIVVEVSEELYAFPLACVDHVLKVAQDDLQSRDGQTFIDCKGERLGVFQAADLLGMPDEGKKSDLFSVLVISDRQNRYGIIVNRVLGERELVLRDLDERLGNVKDIAAAAMLEDGSLLLIVDAESIISSIKESFVTEK